MSEAIAFDTHRFVKNLTASGFTETQAEALADEQIHLLNANLATRSDLAVVRSDLAVVKSDLAVVKSDLEVKIDTVRADILKWMVAALTAHTAVIAALVQFLVRTA